MSVVAAAIRALDGRVLTLLPPARHHTLLNVARCLDDRSMLRGEQGFIDSDGRFMSRGRAASMALGAGQIAKLRWPPALYSEDLW